jgi:hypothetical protein
MKFRPEALLFSAVALIAIAVWAWVPRYEPMQIQGNGLAAVLDRWTGQVTFHFASNSRPITN